MRSQELSAMLKLALPIIIMQIGMVMFGVVDTIFMGKLGKEAIAAVGLGHALIFVFYIFGVGTLYGVDALSSHAVGAKNDFRSAQIVVHSLLVAFLVATFNFIIFTSFSLKILHFFQVDAHLIPLISIYIDILKWFYFPALFFVACRQYLQSHSIVKSLLLILLVANLINIFLNYTLVFGNWGFPRMEIRGTGYATIIANIWLAFATGFIVLKKISPYKSSVFKFDSIIFKDLIRLGVPGGIQTFFEVSVFSIVSLVVGRLGSTAMAAHQLTLNLASVTFMVPLGISYAAAVRVGYGVGAKSHAQSIESGTIALKMGILFMCCTCAIFFIFPRTLLSLYTTDPVVLAVGVELLRVAGFFQVFDGAQIVLTGMLRGFGDTKTSMLANLFSHWGIGFPLGLLLTFTLGLGAKGLWLGLSFGLGGVALLLWFAWKKKIRSYS